MIPVEQGSGPDTLFYDGTCNLCHRTVRFVLAADTSGGVGRFAPLDSEACRATLSEEQQKTLPDSVVVHGSDGSVFIRSDAIVRILRRLGGVWKFLGGVLLAIPRPVRDRGYDFIASIRYRVFGRAQEACPILPPGYRRRWLP